MNSLKPNIFIHTLTYYLHQSDQFLSDIIECKSYLELINYSEYLKSYYMLQILYFFWVFYFLSLNSNQSRAKNLIDRRVDHTYWPIKYFDKKITAFDMRTCTYVMRLKWKGISIKTGYYKLCNFSLLQSNFFIFKPLSISILNTF